MGLLDLTRWAVLYRSALTKQKKQIEHSSASQPVIGHTDQREPVYWLTATTGVNCHQLVLGSSGAGKTILAAFGLVQEIYNSEKQEQPTSFLLVDAKGDLISALLMGLASLAPHRLADVHILDPFSAAGFPLNLNKLALGNTPLDIRSLQLAELISEVSTSTGGQQHLSMGSRQKDAIQHVVLGALACKHKQANILFALDALSQPKGLKKLGAITTSKRAQQFLMTARLSDELRVSCSSRIRAALAASDSLERLVTADSCIQWDQLLAPGKICLVDLGRPIGGMSFLQAFYAGILCKLGIEHLMERPSPWAGHPCRIAIDEAQVVASVLAGRAESILTTGRSKGVSLTTISQGTTLLHKASDTLLSVLMCNTPTKFIGRLAAPDAELLAREQSPAQGVEESLSAIRGRFTASITNFKDREFYFLTPGQRQRFVSAEVDVAGWQRAAQEHQVEIEAAKNRLALPQESRPRLTLSDISPTAQRRPRRKSRSKKPDASKSRPAPAQVFKLKPSTAEDKTPAPEPTKTKPTKPRSRWG